MKFVPQPKPKWFARLSRLKPLSAAQRLQKGAQFTVTLLRQETRT